MSNRQTWSLPTRRIDDCRRQVEYLRAQDQSARFCHDRQVLLNLAPPTIFCANQGTQDLFTIDILSKTGPHEWKTDLKPHHESGVHNTLVLLIPLGTREPPGCGHSDSLYSLDLPSVTEPWWHTESHP